MHNILILGCNLREALPRLFFFLLATITTSFFPRSLTQKILMRFNRFKKEVVRNTCICTSKELWLYLSFEYTHTHTHTHTFKHYAYLSSLEGGKKVLRVCKEVLSTLLDFKVEILKDSHKIM